MGFTGDGENKLNAIFTIRKILNKDREAMFRQQDVENSFKN